jgi:hypothetical protein
MNLFSKIQTKLQEGGKAKTSSNNQVESLNNLPDQEKIKVLDYLNTIKDLNPANNE